MIKDDKVRLTKLQDLLARLRRGENVQNRQLRTWLGEQGYKEYEDHWSNAVDQRKMLASKPGEIIEYEGLLKKAIMLYNRGESASLRRHRSASQLHAKAQTAFEKALLRLEEMISQDPSLQMWLDRPCDFTAGGNLSIDPIGVPRAITSRSLENLSDGVSAAVDSKRQCKIRAVEAEIERIQNPAEHLSDAEIAEKLRRLKAGWNLVGIS